MYERRPILRAISRGWIVAFRLSWISTGTHAAPSILKCGVGVMYWLERQLEFIASATKRGDAP
jgi:hypothetical protein